MAALAASTSPIRAAEPLALEEAGIGALGAAMAAGQLTARALTEHFLRRIEAIDRHGPRLNAVIEVNPDALAIAESLDRERTSGKVRGPLHGIPVLIKDNIDTADQMLTTAGSLALLGSRPPRDSFVAERLRAAGAIILGKTNLSEWANIRSLRSSSGWSARGGQTRNPYVLDRNPCGSSSGSGVAVAAGLATVAVGTETDGSIVCPSAVNGIVGVKPTIGLVSRRGIIPISSSQDTAGPMARSVVDAAILLQALAGPDSEDPATQIMAARPFPDYAAALRPDGLKGARIGVLRKHAEFHEGVAELFDEAVKAIRAAGAELVDPCELELPQGVDDDEMTVLLYELKDGIARYLSARPAGPKTLADLIAFNRAQSSLEMPYFRQEIFELAEAKGPLTDPAYRAARARSLEAAGRRGIDAVLKAHRLDALIAPSMGPAWPTDLVTGDHFLRGASGPTTPAAIAGYPHVTVPAGLLHQLPIGVSFVGPAFSEARLLRLAHAFEQATRARRPPAFRPSLD